MHGHHIIEKEAFVRVCLQHVFLDWLNGQRVLAIFEAFWICRRLKIHHDLDLMMKKDISKRYLYHVPASQRAVLSLDSRRSAHRVLLPSEQRRCGGQPSTEHVLCHRTVHRACSTVRGTCCIGQRTCSMAIATRLVVHIVLLAIGYWLLAIGYWLFGFWLIRL